MAIKKLPGQIVAVPLRNVRARSGRVRPHRLEPVVQRRQVPSSHDLLSRGPHHGESLTSQLVVGDLLPQGIQIHLLREKMRWPEGVRCPVCGAQEISQVTRKKETKNKRGPLSLCLVFHDCHLPLGKWSRAMALVIDAKKGWFALQLKLGCNCPTAWHLCHRIREAMDETGWMEADRNGPQEATAYRRLASVQVRTYPVRRHTHCPGLGSSGALSKRPSSYSARYSARARSSNLFRRAGSRVALWAAHPARTAVGELLPRDSATDASAHRVNSTGCLSWQPHFPGSGISVSAA